MTTWRDDAYGEIEKRTKDGEDVDHVVRDVADRYSVEIKFQFERDMAKKLRQQMKKEWAEPNGIDADDPDQLSLALGDQVFRIPDWPVRIVADDGSVKFIPAHRSTAEQRQDSNEARIQHHQGWVRRAEAEHSRDREQTAKMARSGLDVTLPWSGLVHTLNGTLCWRCGLGWRNGDPFERGHSDAPKVQGGTVVEWEHRSCNRSAKANPVARAAADE